MRASSPSTRCPRRFRAESVSRSGCCTTSSRATRAAPSEEREMTVREILKMGDPRLLRVAQPVTAFGTPALHALIADMFETMEAAEGVGLAAPQIGVDLSLVIFGFDHNDRYPDAPPVPRTILL